jgi:predicted oxidoreductase
MISGVPAHVDGRMIEITQSAGGTVIHPDRMWHYVEGIRNWDPIWPMHGIRVIPGPSSLWLDATGARLPVPLFPGYDTLGTLAHIMQTGHDHTWFVLDERIIAKEFALSGSEQNPDITSDSWKAMLRTRVGSGAPPPVEAFKRHGVDFVIERDLDALIAGMRRLDDTGVLDPSRVREEVLAHDRETENPFSKDMQLAAIREARRYLPDRITRVVAPHRLTDPDAGPLIAVRLHVLTRKTLGGIQTDLDGRVLRADGAPLPGLYAAGEVAGFGGGGIHGYRALEGTFLGGCLFSGRTAGRALAARL